MVECGYLSIQQIWMKSVAVISLLMDVMSARTHFELIAAWSVHVYTTAQQDPLQFYCRRERC